MIAVLPSLVADAEYEDGMECPACGNYHWDEYVICEECGMCENCAPDYTCPYCDGCNWCAEYWCGNCDACPDCGEIICDSCGEACFKCADDSMFCKNCETCEACNDGTVCPYCGEACYECADDSEFCKNCGACPECGEAVCESCGEACFRCTDDSTFCKGCNTCAACNGDTTCTSCGEACYECADDSLFCKSCMTCGGCNDETACTSCGEACFLCADDSLFCKNCMTCGSCNDETACTSCGEACFLCADDSEFCKNCMTCGACNDHTVCPDCGEACYECADDSLFCVNCGLCGECNGGTVCPGCRETCGECEAKDTCPNCEYCSDCTELCEGCGEYCAECSDMCGGCGLCEECTGDSICPGCGETCFECETKQQCRSCVLCEDCVDDICDDCSERCTECDDMFCMNCGTCSDCNGGTTCPDCLETCGECEAEAQCQSCFLCANCTVICEDCGEVCADCDDGFCLECNTCSSCNGDTACPECRESCASCSAKNQCQECWRCEDCTDICESCLEICKECSDGWCDNCNLCGDCNGDTVCPDCGNTCLECGNIDQCLECYLCADCTVLCDACGQICEECAEGWCNNCGSCSDCAENSICPGCEETCFLCGNKEQCEGCFTCEECAVICTECGDYCSECDAGFNLSARKCSACSAGVTVISQPADTVILRGQKGTFTFLVDGSGVSYQWQYNDGGWKNISGANASTLSYLTYETMQFRCVAAVNGETVYSRTVTCTVTPVPEVKDLREMIAGYQTDKSAGISAGTIYDIKYFNKDGTPLTHVPAADTDYIVKIFVQFSVAEAAALPDTPFITWNGRTSSKAEYLGENRYAFTFDVRSSALGFLSQPKDMAVTEGGTAQFVLGAYPYSVTHQWQIYKNGAWQDLSGERFNYYMVENAAASDAARYRCRITYGGASVYSNEVTLTVAPPIQITGLTAPEAGKPFDTSAVASEGVVASVLYNGKDAKDGVAQANESYTVAVVVQLPSSSRLYSAKELVAMWNGVRSVHGEVTAPGRFIFRFECATGAAGMPGDVDGDHKISSADARLALRRAVNLETYAPGSREYIACDADRDGKVTANDARSILRAAVNLEDPATW